MQRLSKPLILQTLEVKPVDYRAILPAIAICGAIALGVMYPSSYSQAAITVLSGAVTGYYGVSTPKKNQD